MSRYPEITHLPVVSGWCDLREAAKIYGEIAYGEPVTLRQMQTRVNNGYYPSARTISRHFIILRKTEVVADAQARKAQVDQAAASGMSSSLTPDRPTAEQIAERLRRTPPPPNMVKGTRYEGSEEESG